MKTITSDTFNFLDDLSRNNNREWFDQNKPRYQAIYNEFKGFHLELMELMKAHDQIEKGRVYRIYRDVRFSKDKTPYKPYLAGNFKRATHYLRGGYYFQIERGNSFLAGGFFGPNAQDLLHVRNQISQYPDPLVQILADKDFDNYFGGLKGEKVKTSPKGFSQEDEAIDLIRHKQFYVEHSFSDKEVLAKDFMIKLNDGFLRLKPFFDYMSEILTTDLNGESLVD